MIWTATYVRAGLDLSNGSVVELSGVRLPVLDAELLLDTNGVTLGETALVNVASPAQVGLGGSGVDTRLESDNELSGDNVGPLGDGSGSRKSSGEQRSEEQGDVLNVDHLEVCGT